MSLVDTLMGIFGFKKVEPVIPEKVRKRPKLYEVKAYSYTDKHGNVVNVKAHIKGGK